jgi:hypothetical protein
VKTLVELEEQIVEGLEKGSLRKSVFYALLFLTRQLGEKADALEEEFESNEEDPRKVSNLMADASFNLAEAAAKGIATIIRSAPPERKHEQLDLLIEDLVKMTVDFAEGLPPGNNRDGRKEVCELCKDKYACPDSPFFNVGLGQLKPLTTEEIIGAAKAM